jgi:hypothetical protein
MKTGRSAHVTLHRWQGGDGGSLRSFEPGSDELEERVELSKLMITIAMLAALIETEYSTPFDSQQREEAAALFFVDEEKICSRATSTTTLAVRKPQISTGWLNASTNTIPRADTSTNGVEVQVRGFSPRSGGGWGTRSRRGKKE